MDITTALLYILISQGYKGILIYVYVLIYNMMTENVMQKLKITIDFGLQQLLINGISI